MDEQKKYEVIKKLVEGKGNKNAAASHKKIIRYRKHISI